MSNYDDDPFMLECHVLGRICEYVLEPYKVLKPEWRESWDI